MIAKICAHCGSKLTRYEQKKFCSSSCAASFNNPLKPKRKAETSNCLVCSKSVPKKYRACSIACNVIYRRKLLDEKILQGLVKTRKTLRLFLIRRDGHKCSVCLNEKWMGEPIPLDLDHVDGNAGNDTLCNIRVICPNCHAQTPTYKNKNKGNGRGSRGLKEA